MCGLIWWICRRLRSSSSVAWCQSPAERRLGLQRCPRRSERRLRPSAASVGQVSRCERWRWSGSFAITWRQQENQTHLVIQTPSLRGVAKKRRRNHMTSMTSTLGPHTADHHMTRVDIPTGRAFASFCDAFEQAVPAFDFAHIRHITENGGTWQDIAAAVAANAPNDMMRYATLDMTALYATTDHRTKAVEYFVGNHVIADQMVRRDPKILLYAPLRILVHGDGDAVVSID